MNDIIYYLIWVVSFYIIIGMIILGFHLRWLEKNDPKSIRELNEDPREACLYTIFIVVWWLPNAVSWLRTVLSGDSVEDDEDMKGW